MKAWFGGAGGGGEAREERSGSDASQEGALMMAGRASRGQMNA